MIVSSSICNVSLSKKYKNELDELEIRKMN